MTRKPPALITHLADFKLIEDGGLASGVEAQHEYAHLLVPKDLRKEVAHVCAWRVR